MIDRFCSEQKMEEGKKYSLEKRDFLINKYQDNSINLSRLIITLSTGSIVFSASLIKNGDRIFGGWAIVTLILCWISLGISVLVGVFFLKEILEEISKKVELHHKAFISDGNKITPKIIKLYNEIIPDIRKKIKSCFSWQFWTFLSGLILLGIHCIIMLV